MSLFIKFAAVWVAVVVFMSIDLDAFAEDILEEALKPDSQVANAVVDDSMQPANFVVPDIAEWIEDRFYIVETKRPMQLEWHQKEVLRAFTEQRPDGRFKWQTCLYTTIKKSAKTSIAAAYMRWSAECWGPYGEIYHMGNKLDQAKKRAFKLMMLSIRLGPAAMKSEWDIQATKMEYINGSTVEPLPVNAAGEAGGNQSLTVWTELWGYIYEEQEQMWSELQPVPTRWLGQRFAESYAGYEGESNLLKRIWDLAMAGEKLHDDLPIWGNEAASIVAYIDQGEVARRMPWQTPEYYERASATELPHEYRRLHLNEWVSSQNALVELPLWDRLNYNDPKNEISRPNEFKLVTVGLDASVSGDCTALVVVGFADGVPYELETHVWTPPKGGKLDYDETIKPQLQQVFSRYKVKCVAYDPYQLHDLITTLQKSQRGILFYAFPQGAERVEADTKLVKRIIQDEVYHGGDLLLREHIQNADGKVSGTEKAIRIVKRNSNKHVDAVVALSMAVHKGAELILTHTDAPPVRKLKVKGW